MLKKITPVIAILAVISLTVIGCQNHHPAGPVSDNHAAVKINFLKSSLVEQINQVVLQVVSMDMIVHADTTVLQNGAFAFDPFELPVGSAFFIVSATNAFGQVLYQGSTAAEIISGIENDIAIVLLPAIPMVKLSPYHQSVTVGEQFTTTVELFNIQRLFNGSFKIAYNPDLLAYENIAQQADPAWDELIVFARDAGDTVVVSVSRIQGTPDEVPLNVFALLDLRFRAIQPTSTELRLVVDVLEDFDGQVSEFPALFVDHQTVVATGAASR